MHTHLCSASWWCWSAHPPAAPAATGADITTMTTHNDITISILSIVSIRIIVIIVVIITAIININIITGNSQSKRLAANSFGNNTFNLRCNRGEPLV